VSAVFGEAAFLSQCTKTYQTIEALRRSPLTFMELAETVLKEVSKLGQHLLQGWLERDPQANPEEVVCHRCQRAMRIQEREQSRDLQTAMGEIEYKRAYAVCDRCGRTRVPLDEALGIPPTGPSVEALQRICHAAVATKSFERGSEVLRVHARLDISRKHVRCLAEKEGGILVKKRAEEVAAYQKDQRIDESPVVPPALMVITADGGRVQTRNKEKKERWKEDKIGVVYDAQIQPHPTADKDRYKGAKALTKTYVATMESWETAGWKFLVEAVKRGYSKAKVKLFLGDGARAIREMKNLHFPEATFILDWSHAVEHLSESAKAAFGDGTEESRQWYQRQKDRLWEGKCDEIIQELQTLSRHMGFPTKEDTDFSARTILHRNAFSYFPNNKEAMNYPYFRSQGWPLGSGVVEGAVKQFGLRLKGSEKFWNVSNTGAEEMLALCSLFYSEDGRWGRYWKMRSQPYQKQ